MTVPNTPPDPGKVPAGELASPAADAAGSAATPALQGTAGQTPAPAAYPYGALPVLEKAERAPRRPLPPELRIGALTVLVCLLLGFVMAGLWVWLAPQVPLLVKGNRILYADPEGEQRAGADAVFALIGLGAGVVTALGAFLLTRRRGGGIAVAVGLTVGGLAGSLIAWRLGIRLGPTADVIAHARQVGDGHRFTDALRLGAKGALLVWPMTAMVLLLALSAAFGKREQDPPPYWEGGHRPGSEPHYAPPADGVTPAPGHAPFDAPAGPDTPPPADAPAPPSFEKPAGRPVADQAPAERHERPAPPA
ncbi:hypothetical protein GCM10010495_47780 [Kitasatospora herbaricolor]|uniref:hypothetical protein n=1 Tax=Kitasatospora herbaricolor TaxID=68217 RepID=UPI00174CE8C5|nr:hypothetical protein [Kitasatospora herbaricolor]MDQ0307763.1 uncharacterized protein YqgC (DUF456 family) [Kitasatospora herbaricolor]GGV26261.1 hypothetical protein GCM10010495_47780 [Kitasatospora herbaricolor]